MVGNDALATAIGELVDVLGGADPPRASLRVVCLDDAVAMSQREPDADRAVEDGWAPVEGDEVRLVTGLKSTGIQNIASDEGNSSAERIEKVIDRLP